MRIKSSFEGLRLFWYQRVKGEELRSSALVVFVNVVGAFVNTCPPPSSCPGPDGLGVEAHDDPDRPLAESDDEAVVVVVAVLPATTPPPAADPPGNGYISSS